MDMHEYFKYKKIDEDKFRSVAFEKCKPDSNEVLTLVGSVAEGLANTKSDVDLILLTQRESMHGRSMAWNIDNCLVDVEYISFSYLKALTEKANSWNKESWDTTNKTPLNVEDRKLLHRIYNGKRLNSSSVLEDLGWFDVDTDLLCKLKLHFAKYMARTIQVDMVGHEDSGDYKSLMYASHELFGHAIDALLAYAGFSIPSHKWRSRLVDSMKDVSGLEELNGSKLSTHIWDLHTFPQMDPLEILETAHKISSFSRYLFYLSEMKLVFDSECDFEIQNIENPACFPDLKFDAEYAFNGSTICLGRLNEFGSIIEMSRFEWEFILKSGYLRSLHCVVPSRNILDSKLPDNLKVIFDQVCEAGFVKGY